MDHYSEQWIADWCVENGWTDWFRQQSSYWAFPPHAVMPTPIPPQALRSIKAEKGLSPDEKMWSLVALGSLALGIGLSFTIQSPIPGIAAFSFGAIVMGHLDDED
ncbi:MAG: hypothetical protein VKJ24_08230 [Synechococcales bacterium]|nr:hypothetical protein [Synechococcales bacterium]